MLLIVVAVLAILLWYAVWPPYRSPQWWRHLTRPLRRLVRPGHYR